MSRLPADLPVAARPEFQSQALADKTAEAVTDVVAADDEIGAIIAWSDALVLPYREASQSGAAAAAIAARRFVVATRVGSLHPLFTAYFQ